MELPAAAIRVHACKTDVTLLAMQPVPGDQLESAAAVVAIGADCSIRQYRLPTDKCKWEAQTVLQPERRWPGGLMNQAQQQTNGGCSSCTIYTTQISTGHIDRRTT